MQHPPMLTIARWTCDHPVRWICGIMAMTLLLGSLLPRLRIETDGGALLPKDDPIVAGTDEDRRRFNDPEQVIILITSSATGPAIDSAQGLRFLVEAHHGAASVPAADGSRVRSLASLAEPPSSLRDPALRRYLDWIPDDPIQLEYLVHRIHLNPLADGMLVSSDGRAAALYVPLAPEHGRKELVTQLQEWVERLQPGPFEIRLTGPLVAETLLGASILQDLEWLIPVMVAAISLLLLLALRTMGGVVIPLIEVLVVLVWTLGTMALWSVPITLVSTILPVVLMAIAITDEIHLLEHLQQRLASRPSAESRDPTRDEVRSALDATIRAVQRPIVLTSLTTAIGFLSYLSASMAPIRSLGLFISLGIMLAMVLSFTLIPALILALPPSWFSLRAAHRRSSRRRPVLAFEHFVVRHTRACLVFGIVLTLASVLGLLRLVVQDSWISGFDPTSDLVTAERDLNAKLWGSYRYDLVLESNTPGYFQSSDGIGLLEQIVRVASQAPHVGGVLSHLTHDRLVAGALGLHPPLSAISDRSLIRVAGLVRLIRRVSDLEQLLLPDARTARARIFVKSADYRRARELDAYLAQRLPALLAHRPVNLRTSGDLPVAMVVVHAIVTNQLRSIALTLLGIALLLIATLRRPLLAAALIAPATAAVAITLGALGVIGISLGIASSMFSALSVGIGVDLALHLAHAYRRAYLATASPGRHQEAMLAALATTGRAIRCNVSVLALGFSVLALSALGPNRLLGILLASALVACYLSTLLLLPGLLEQLAARGHLCNRTSR